MDKTITNAYYNIVIDPATQLPVNVTLVVLSAQKGETETEGKKITGGRHAAFHFRYQLSSFGKLTKPVIPAEALKQLARI